MATKKPFILIKFATRSRPEKCLSALDNIFDTISDKSNYTVLLTFDEDDVTMYNDKMLIEIKRRLKDGHKILLNIGKSDSKIHAINRGMDLYTAWDILVNFSDDMRFEVPNWDERIRNDMMLHFSDTDGVLHYNDGYTRNKCCTLSIMGKKYYDRFDYIYHPDYISLWCDVEYTEIAVNLNKIQYFDDIIFKHNHPSNVGGYIDSQYMKTEAFYEEDGKTYKSRKKIIDRYKSSK